MTLNNVEIKNNISNSYLYIIPMNKTETFVLDLAAEIRQQGPWRVDVDVSGLKLKYQMRQALASGARFVMVIGDEEIASGVGRFRDLKISSEVEVELTGTVIVEELTHQSIK